MKKNRNSYLSSVFDTEIGQYFAVRDFKENVVLTSLDPIWVFPSSDSQNNNSFHELQGQFLSLLPVFRPEGLLFQPAFNNSCLEMSFSLGSVSAPHLLFPLAEVVRPQLISFAILKDIVYPPLIPGLAFFPVSEPVWMTY